MRIVLIGALIGAVVLLSGCTSAVNNNVINASIKLCEVNGGLLYIRSKSMNGKHVATAYCNNGAIFVDALKKSIQNE